MEKLEIYMRARHDEYDARGTYDNGVVTIHTGSRINPVTASHIKKDSQAILMRKDSDYVDLNGNVIKECVFNSPSTAAQFVNGRISNGYIAWRVDEEHSLKKWLSTET